MNTGRVVLITGANRGIGRGVAEYLKTRGYRVAVTYRSEPPEGFNHDNDPNVLSVKCDVTSIDDINAAFDRVESVWGNVEVLIPNAGITKDGLLIRMSESDWDDVIDTNLKAPWACIKRALPGMSKARFGRIVLLSSVIGIMGGPGQSNYGASKAGLIGLARCVTREYAARGITANVVAPGPIATDMFHSLGEAAATKLVELVPAKRAGTVDEVAAAIAFLASDEAAYVSGVVLPVDGGAAMGA